MKNCSLILAVILLFSCFTVSIYADTSVNYRYEEAKKFLDQLEITKGIERNADANITRAEFAAMAVRATNTKLSGINESKFTDCSTNAFANEIYMAHAMGITNGTSETTFSPDDGVTLGVAAKMMITVLGYAANAEAVGGYPSGYLQLSTNLGIFKGIPTGDAALTIKNAYIIIYNTLFADVAVVNGISGENIVTNSVEGKNLLTENFGLKNVNGIISKAGYYTLDSDIGGIDKIEISGKILSAHIDATEYFGYAASVWYDENKMEVRVILPKSTNKSVTINAADVIGCNNNILNVDNGTDLGIKYYLDKELSFVLNGRVIVHTNESFMFKDGMLTLIDNDNDGKYEIVLADKVEYFIIDNINTSERTIFDSNSECKRISLEESSSKYVEIEINGIKADFSDLDKDMVCEIYRSQDNSVCIVKSANISPLIGKITEISKDEIKVDGVSYRLNTYFGKTGITLSIGSSYRFLMASDMSITSVLGKSFSDTKYGYFLAFGKKEGVSSNPEIKLLTSENSKEIFTLGGKVLFNGELMSNNDARIESVFVNGDNPVYQLIRYKETNGIVTMIDTEEVSSLEKWNPEVHKDNDNLLTKYVEGKEVWYRTNTGFGVPNVSFKSAAVFVVPYDIMSNPNQKFDDELFFADGISSLVNDETYIVDAFDYDENYLPGAVVVFENPNNPDNNTIPSNESLSYMVCRVSDAIDDEGEIVKLIRVYSNGNYNEYYIKMDLFAVLMNENRVPTEGDVIRLTADKSGYIKGLAIDVDYDKESGVAKVNYSDGVSQYFRSGLTYYGGIAMSQTSGYLLVKASDVPGDYTIPENGLMNLCTSSAKYIVYNKQTGLVKAGNSANIITASNEGLNKATRVFCRATYYNVTNVFVYEN